MKNIAAWTGPTPRDPELYAEYVSINETPQGRVSIAVRNSMAEVVEIEIDRDDFRKLIDESTKNVAP